MRDEAVFPATGVARACARMCMRVRVHLCACACVRARVRVCACMCMFPFRRGRRREREFRLSSARRSVGWSQGKETIVLSLELGTVG